MRTLRSLVALATLLTLGLSQAAQCQEKPVAVVAIAPLERVTDDFTYLMRLCGVPQFGALGSMMIKQWSDGLDIKRPAGLTVQLVDGQPVPLAFLPLEDRKSLFRALEAGGQFADDLGNGLYAFDAPGQTIYAKEQGKWLFVSRQEEDLKKLPADPLALLGDAPKRYDIAVHVNVQALPAELRNGAVEQLREGLERRLAEDSDKSDEEKATAEEMGKASIQQIERLINETDQVTVGVATGSSLQKLQIEVETLFVSGSELAKQSAQLNNLTSDFTGLLIEEAAFTIRSTALVSDTDKAMAKSNMRSMYSQLETKLDDSGSMPTASKEALKKFAKGMIAIVDKTIDGGKLDGGAAVSLADGKVQAVLGGSVADGAQLEKEVKQLVASLGTGPEIPKFEFNYAKHQNVNLHKVTVPIQTDDPQMQKVFGNELKLVVGTGDKSFYVALDPNGDALIKSALDRVNGKKSVNVIPGEMVLQTGQVLAFVQSIAPNPVIESISATLEQVDGKDKIKLLTTPIERGMRYQISIDDGVLKAGGAAAKLGQGGGPGF